MYECSLGTCLVPVEARKVGWILWNFGYKWLLFITWALGVELVTLLTVDPSVFQPFRELADQKCKQIHELEKESAC